LLKDAGGGVVYHGTLPEGLTFANHQDEAQSATIQTVEPGSDAERAGFQANDRIVSVDGKRVYNWQRLTGIVRSYPENAPLDFMVERGGKDLTMKIKLPRMQLSPGPSYIGAIGARVEPTGEGLKIVSLDRTGPAERAGLINGDIIIRVDDHAASLDFADFLSAKKPGDTLSLQYRRTGPEGVSRRVVTVSPDFHK
jgi:S1-C subfamily serine protease